MVAVDQSTSGTKAILVDRSGRMAARASLEHKQYYPQAGWVEHDPAEIYENVKQAIQTVLREAAVEPAQLAALTITNQRETAVIWDRTTGEPIFHAIVWQCQRTAALCRSYQLAGYEPMVQTKTGLMLDPYFSASKFQWILDHVEGAREKAAEGRLLAGTIDSWLIWKLTGGSVHKTDYTNASRTSLFNIHTLTWDRELCELFHIPISMLPEVEFSDAIFGFTNDKALCSEQIPISGVIGDSQAALFGNGCFHTGMAKATYGTGTSVLMNVGNKPVFAGNKLVAAIAWGMNGTVTYALEAVIRTSGDSIKWVRDNLGLFQTFQEMEQLLAEVSGNEGVYLVPAFVGLGAPYWDPDARASITGMNRGTRKAHVIRAAIESIAYQVRDAVELMQAESGVQLKELRADGGASDNAALMQFQADVLAKTVMKSHVTELSAMGSVYIGGFGSGFWESLSEIEAQRMPYEVYEPLMPEAEREQNYQGWKRAVASVLKQKSLGGLNS